MKFSSLTKDFTHNLNIFFYININHRPFWTKMELSESSCYFTLSQDYFFIIIIESILEC